MIQVYPENISTYQALKPEGTFVNLDDYMSDDLKSKLTGQDMCTVDGQTLAISSYAWGTTGIFYRKSMLEEKGINPDDIKTLDDFRDACLKFTEDGGYATGIVSGTHAFTVSEWNRLVARPVSGGLYFPNGDNPSGSVRNQRQTSVGYSCVRLHGGTVLRYHKHSHLQARRYPSQHFRKIP